TTTTAKKCGVATARAAGAAHAAATAAAAGRRHQAVAAAAAAGSRVRAAREVARRHGCGGCREQRAAEAGAAAAPVGAATTQGLGVCDGEVLDRDGDRHLGRAGEGADEQAAKLVVAGEGGVAGADRDVVLHRRQIALQRNGAETGGERDGVGSAESIGGDDCLTERAGAAVEGVGDVEYCRRRRSCQKRSRCAHQRGAGEKRQSGTRTLALAHELRTHGTCRKRENSFDWCSHHIAPRLARPLAPPKLLLNAPGFGHARPQSKLYLRPTVNPACALRGKQT